MVDSDTVGNVSGLRPAGRRQQGANFRVHITLPSERPAGWFARQSLTRKLLLAFTLIFLCILILSAFTLWTFRSGVESRRVEDVQLEMVQQAQQAGQAMRLQQVAVRDYLLGTGSKPLDRLEQARQVREKALLAAIALAGASAEGERIARVHEVALAWDRGVTTMLRDHAPPSPDGAPPTLGQQRAAIQYLEENNAALSTTVLADLDSLYGSEMRRFVQQRIALNEVVRKNQIVIVALLVLALLMAALSVWGASRLIARPIHVLTRQMRRLAGGEFDIEVPYRHRADEIGDSARAVEVFRLASIANRDRNWVKISAGEVATALQAAMTQDAYVQTLVNEVTPRIGAGIGVFFAWDEQAAELRLLGSYGFRHRKHLGLRYALGEGLIGQCALERKRIVLDRVPEAFFAIHSATGEAVPSQVMAVPLLLQDRLLGVFEFGTFGAIGAMAEGFVDELLPTAALGLDNIRRAEHTRELLEKTRAQALALEQSEEKLRMQEELRATNEELQQKTVELEEHTQRLAASEEELRVQAEELQASNEELRQKGEILNEQKQVLEDLQRETELKAQALARASQYKTDFLANMSHELRTPLNSLLILSRELAENAQQHLDAEEVESARVIHDSGSNLLRLINDILDLSKIEAGKMDVYREEVEVEAITREVMRHFRHVALDNRLAFDIEVGEDVPATLGTDRPKLQQILNNLLGNAFKFTHEGSVTLRVTRAGHALLRRIGAGDAAHYLAMSVADTGIGIPQERLDSIFEAFEQVDSSTSRHYGGSGLGLAIARKLAQLLGGQLLADSVVEEGSTFTLMLPLDEAAPVVVARPVQDMMRNPAALSHAATPAARLIDWIPDDRHTISPGDTAILTIEDDPAFARILVDMIRRKGHRALAAADGETGLELARRYRPTAVLLDVMLPGMDGWSVMEQLHREPALRSIPVHFISAVDEAAKGAAMGAVGYLTKPVARKALTDAFDRLLDVAGKIVRRLLLVDDDVDSRLAIRHLLQGEKLQIDEAASGEEALEKLQKEGYDCIVLDLNLGGISGAELLERASAGMTLPPVVIYSGHELSREESLRLRQYTDSIVIKGQRSQERLLDEVSLFLHSIGSRGAQGAQEADGGLSGHVVLLVDDDMRNLFALSKSLRARGMNVLMAQDGFKALRQLEENDGVELVLMDIMMPGKDGYETTREIRRQPQWAHLPIIAVTAKAMPGDRDKCLEAGANDYLTKPVDMDKLLSMMRVWLQK